MHDPEPGACIVCTPDACCRPIHTSHPGLTAAAEAVSAR